MISYLSTHTIHEVRTSDALREAWKIENLCGSHQLSTL